MRLRRTRETVHTQDSSFVDAAFARSCREAEWHQPASMRQTAPPLVCLKYHMQSAVAGAGFAQSADCVPLVWRNTRSSYTLGIAFAAIISIARASTQLWRDGAVCYLVSTVVTRTTERRAIESNVLVPHATLYKCCAVP